MPVPVTAMRLDFLPRLPEDDSALAACGHKNGMTLNLQIPPLYLKAHCQIFLPDRPLSAFEKISKDVV